MGTVGTRPIHSATLRCAHAAAQMAVLPRKSVLARLEGDEVEVMKTPGERGGDLSRTAIFTPTDLFSSNTTFNVSISTTARNLAGVPLESDFIWNFSTAVTLDTTAPLVSSTAPAGGDAAVAINRKVGDAGHALDGDGV